MRLPVFLIVAAAALGVLLWTTGPEVGEVACSDAQNAPARPCTPTDLLAGYVVIILVCGVIALAGAALLAHRISNRRRERRLAQSLKI